MSFLVGIVDKRAVVVDTITACAVWLRDHGLESFDGCLPRVRIYSDWDSFEAATAGAAWRARDLGHEFETLLGCAVETFLPARWPSLRRVKRAEVEGELRLVAACWAYLEHDGRPTGPAAEAFVELVHERWIERRAWDQQRGFARIAKAKLVQKKRDQGAGNRAEVASEWLRLGRAAPPTPDRNRAAKIAKRLRLNESTVRRHLIALGLR